MAIINQVKVNGIPYDLAVNAENVSGTVEKAAKLSNTSAIGSVSKPVFINENGEPVACDYTLSKSVPSDAVFTDTTYTEATPSKAGLMSAADKTKLNSTPTFVLSGTTLTVTV